MTKDWDYPRPAGAQLRLTQEELEAGRSPKGGFTKGQLAKWGVAWPPPKGWQERLLSGTPEPAGPDYHHLLRQLVALLVERGLGSAINELPDVLAAFGSRLPTVEEVIGRNLEPPCIVTGGIRFDDRVYEFKCARWVK